MIELISPREIAKSPYRQKLLEAGIKGGWNYALDHAWLFEQIDQYVKANDEKWLITLDVGCGRSMLHTFLEDELHMGIIGVDRIFGKCPFKQRDKRMDLCIDFSNDNKFFNGTADIVYWCSSIEHNTIPDMKKCLEVSMEALKPGGLFLATFSYSPTTYYFEASQATNLCKEDAQEIFQEQWQGPTDYYEMAEQYKENHCDLFDRYKKRYEKEEIDFIVGAVKKIKQS